MNINTTVATCLVITASMPLLGGETRHPEEGPRAGRYGILIILSTHPLLSERTALSIG